MAVRASIARRELRASRCASLSAGVLQIDEGVADDAGGLLAIGLVDGGDGGRVESWGWSAFTAVPPEARLGTPLPNSWPVAFDQIEQRQLLLREVPLSDAHEQCSTQWRWLPSWLASFAGSNRKVVAERASSTTEVWEELEVATAADSN